MKQSIQLRLGQHLTMTPQLQQAIRLLQLSTLDLRYEIQEALDSNLMLEEAEESERRAAELGGEKRSEPPAAETETAMERELTPEENAIPEELPLDSEWADHFDNFPVSGRGAGNGDSSNYDFFAQHSRPETLQDSLRWQLNLSGLNETELAIATAIIDAIDSDGYLRQSCEELHAMFEDSGLSLAEVEAVLRVIQSFDPPGVGARDLAECLLLQLRQQPPEDPVRRDAMAICQTCFEALSRNELDHIRRHLDLSPEALAAAIRAIRALHPRPGSLVASTPPQYVIPDVFVRKRAGVWSVEMNPEILPKLTVNAEYAKLIRRADASESNTCLRTHLQEARWFIKSLKSRNETVVRVAAKIVEFQQDFLDRGEEAMKPMVLRDVAAALDLHESTISRVTSQKYMHTPRGTYEFKFFFSSHLKTSGGGECSSTAIRAIIRKLVSAETPGKPLSDEKIATLLEEQGIAVARRTIAKYREVMGIPSSTARRRLA